MTNVPPAWREYARLQTSVSSRPRVNSQTWALEAGLNHLLDPAGQVAVGTVIATSLGRENYRIRLRARYIIVDEIDDPQPQLDQRAELRELLASVDETDRAIALATGL